MAIARCCCLIAVIIFILVSNGEAATRRRRGHSKFPIPTKETLPYVAEVMGATSFEEITDDSSQRAGGGGTAPTYQEPHQQESKRVQRKLPADSETSTLDNVPYMEYQGVMGRPGVDFPVLANIPRTDFSCREVKQAGYYADLHTGCQVFHICDGGRKISFLCPNGTIFRQTHLICDWWFRVDCGKSKEQYQESAELLAHDQMIYKKRAEEIAKAMQHGESKTQEQTVQLLDNPPPTTHRPKHQPRRKPSRTSTKVFTTDLDREQQHPAESASFVGNQRHRFGSTSSDSVSRNSFSTPIPTTLPPQVTTTAKPVFTIRVKPNREFSFVELHKQDSKKVPKEDRPAFQPNPYPNVQFVSSGPVEVTPAYSYTHTPSPRIQFSSAKTSKYNSIAMNTKYSSFSNSFSKNNIDLSRATTQLPPLFGSNKTNDIEFIRPEMINSLMETEPTLSYPKFGTPTPASAVNTLHSLASYYESAAADVQKELISKDSDYTKPPVSEILLRAHSGSSAESVELEDMMVTVTSPKPEITNNYSDTVLPSVLTKATQLSYSYLFKNEIRPKENVVKDVTKQVELTTPRVSQVDIREKLPERLVIDNAIIDSKSDIDTKTDDSKEIQQQRESADLRELAQVFTRALSAYLEDPESFKEILAQVRPTEPNHDVTTPSLEDEVLAFSDDNKNMKPQALPVTRTTMRPFTPNDINNFIAAVTNIDSDNSLEVSPASGSSSIEQLDTVHFLTTAAPTSIAQHINNIAVNTSLNNLASGEYYSSVLGSSEDNSYFPTAGGVTDGTRPRYGGFQNNTGEIFVSNRKYSRYGADLPPNITGAPLSEVPTIAHTATTPISITTLQPTEEKPYQKIPEKLNLPDAFDVNNLATNNFFADPSSKLGSEENYSNHKKEDPLLQGAQDFYSNGGDQEKLLIASGTQSLFSANNYFKYSNKENNAKKGEQNNAYTSLYSPFSYTNNVEVKQPAADSLVKEQVNKFPVQDVPALNEESTIPTTTQIGDYLELTTFSQKLFAGKQNEDFSADSDFFSTIDPLTEQATTDSYYSFNSFESQEKKPENQFRVQNVDLGNGVTLERTLKYTKPSAVTWSVPSLTDDVSDDWSEEKDIPPTTYHPQHKLEPVATTPHPFFIPPEPQLEQKAKEMFGGLNETATGKLMDMVDKAASNTTIRKLVLLLVSDSNKENLTVEQSRSNLIQALLVNDGSDSASESTENIQSENALGDGTNDNNKLTKCDDKDMGRMEMSAAHSDRYHGIPCSQNQNSNNVISSTQAPVETSSHMEFSISSSSGGTKTGEKEKISSKYRSGKNYRATESQTAVVGSSLQTTEYNNRLNSAKLFIPSNPDKKIPYNSDARAVELLKSLYNLAAKFG